MSEDTTANRAASLHSTAIDLSEVAAGLADVSTDDGIGKLARILDRIAEEARRIVTQRKSCGAQRKSICDTFSGWASAP